MVKVNIRPQLCVCECGCVSERESYKMCTDDDMYLKHIPETFKWLYAHEHCTDTHKDSPVPFILLYVVAMTTVHRDYRLSPFLAIPTLVRLSVLRGSDCFPFNHYQAWAR